MTTLLARTGIRRTLAVAFIFALIAAAAGAFVVQAADEANPPAAPSFVTPANDSVHTQGTLGDIDWTDVVDGESDPVNYRYQVSSDSGFGTILFETNTGSASEIDASGTGVGEYYIRVSAIDSATTPNESAWSDTLHITVVAPAVVDGTVTPEEFVTVDGSFKGISVGFRTDSISPEATGVTVTMTRDDGSTVTKTANQGVLDIINSGGVDQLTAPFVIMESAFTEEGDTLYWDPAPLTRWSTTTRPVSVSITVSTANGDITAVNGTFNDGAPSWPTYESLLPTLNAENFNTHSDTDYKGINVGFNVSNISEFDEVYVELYDAEDNLLARNDGVLGKLNELLNGSGSMVQLSTPFITENGTYGPEEYWTLGEWQSAEKPAKAVITVNGMVVTNSSLSEQHEWSTIAPDVEAPVITLNGENPMTVRENSTFTDPGAIAVDNKDGAVAVQSSGSVDTATPDTYTITYTATDAAGNTATATREVIVENDEPSRRSSGGGGRSSNSNPPSNNGGEVLGESTNDGGQTTNGEVLGESDFVFTMDLTVGSTGNDVIELQKFLIAQGYLKIAAPTGYFGPLTQAAVAAYQAANGIYPAVGYFGPITRAKVNSL